MRQHIEEDVRDIGLVFACISDQHDDDRELDGPEDKFDDRITNRTTQHQIAIKHDIEGYCSSEWACHPFGYV